MRLECIVDDRRNPAGDRGRGARLEVVDGVHREHLGVEMCMRIDGAGNEEHPTGVDGATRRFERAWRRDVHDLFRDHANISRSDARGRYYSCADDREIEHRDDSRLDVLSVRSMSEGARRSATADALQRMQFPS